jgi:hypothetical protein
MTQTRTEFLHDTSPVTRGSRRHAAARAPGAGRLDPVVTIGDRVFSGWTLVMTIDVGWCRYAARNIRTIITDDRSALELLNNNT